MIKYLQQSFYSGLRKCTFFSIDSKLLLQILIIKCHKLCCTWYAFLIRNVYIAMINQFTRCWISTAILELVDQPAWKFNVCFANDSIFKLLERRSNQLQYYKLLIQCILVGKVTLTWLCRLKIVNSSVILSQCFSTDHKSEKCQFSYVRFADL